MQILWRAASGARLRQIWVPLAYCLGKAGWARLPGSSILLYLEYHD